MSEEAGTGVAALVDGHRVAVGNLDLAVDLSDWTASVLSRASLDGAVVAWSGRRRSRRSHPAGRPASSGRAANVAAVTAAGMTRLVMLTGDRPAPARQIGTVLGLDEVASQQTPADKVARVRAERGSGDGDGRRRGQ